MIIRPIKIAIITSSTDPTNGWGNITCELCRNLWRGALVDLYLPKGSPDIEGFVGRYFPILPKMIFSARTPKLISFFLAGLRIYSYSLIGYGTYDIIHSLFAFPYCITAAVVAKLHRAPLIIGVQGTYGVKPLNQQPDRALLTWAYRQANQIICCSNYTKNRIEKATGIKNIKVIPNGVNYERFASIADISESRGVNES